MAKVTDLGGRPHSGVVQQTVVGLVTNNVDPDELGRIQVKFPTLHSEPTSFWIRQVAPMAGKERGFYALPEVDDEVLVMFLQGSQDVGVVVGQFWNGMDKPPAEAKAALPGPAKTDTGATWSTDQFTDGTKSLDANDRRFWKSRSGHLFVFDDSEGAETVQVWDRTHTLSLVFETEEKRIILANTEGDIHIRTKNDLFLEAGNDIKWRAGNNIEGESVKDTTHKAGQNWTTETGQSASHEARMNFEVSAGQNFKATASMKASIEGSVSFSAKGGASATLEGSGMAEIKGGIVKIN